MDAKQAFKIVKRFVKENVKVLAAHEYEDRFRFFIGSKGLGSADVIVEKESGEAYWGFDMSKEQEEALRTRFSMVDLKTL